MEKKTRQKRAIHHVDPHEIKEVVGYSGENTRLYFSLRLNKLLSDKETAQEDLAIKTRLSMSSISTYRNGKAEPKITALNGIAKVLNVSADYLLGNTTVENPDPNMQATHEFTGLSEQAINVIKNLTPPYLETLNTLYEQGFMANIVQEFGQFLDRDKEHKNPEIIWVASEKEYEEAGLAITWHLHRGITNAIDAVIKHYSGDK